MLRFIQEVNTTTRSCALWDLEEDTEYIVHVQAISIQGQSPASEPLLFKTPREAEKMASKNKGKPGACSSPRVRAVRPERLGRAGGRQTSSKDGDLLECPRRRLACKLLPLDRVPMLPPQAAFTMFLEFFLSFF